MALTFHSVRWKNFLSTGNSFTEIKLTKSPTTLIVGKNGSGKSTLLDALCFALFGKPFRKINKPQLINSINAKDSVVEVQFSVSNKLYKVVRSIKPATFEIYCDGNLVNQDSASRDYQEYLEKNILKMNYKSFTQIVILGSASFTPFMQLSTNDRRGIIEELLDIQIFSSMNSVLKERQSSIKTDIQDVKNEIKITEVRIEAAEKVLRELKADKQAKVDANLQEIERKEEELRLLSESVVQMNEEVEQFTSKCINHENLKAKSTKLRALELQIESNVKKVKKELSFFNENDVCPTCHQNITEDAKNTHIEKCGNKIGEYEKALDDLENKIDDVSQQIADINEIVDDINRLNTKIAVTNTKINEINKFIKRLNGENASILANNTVSSTEESEIEANKNKSTALSEKHKQMVEMQLYYEVASLLLKDTGIKTKIIRQYLPVMNKLINKYLSTMDFFVNFNLDESFNETIKSRHRDEFAYESFSEGEKQKIDLALLFTWRTIAKMKNSVNTNLLILDEIFDSSLDSNATEELLKILNSLGEDTNVFVISHKDDILYDKFRSVIRFEKVNNFSRMAT